MKRETGYEVLIVLSLAVILVGQTAAGVVMLFGIGLYAVFRIGVKCRGMWRRWNDPFIYGEGR